MIANKSVSRMKSGGQRLGCVLHRPTASFLRAHGYHFYHGPPGSDTNNRLRSDTFFARYITSIEFHGCVPRKMVNSQTSLPHLKNRQVRACSSASNGNNASENKRENVKEETGSLDGKPPRESSTKVACSYDAHASLAIQDQKEWLNNEKLSMDLKKKESPFLTKLEKFKNELLRRVIPWEQIHISWESFPYHIDEISKSILVDCVSPHLKHKNLSSLFGVHLPSSSPRILLQSIPGTELYRERIVRALAYDLKVPLLLIDSNFLASCELDCGSFSDPESDICESGDDGSISEAEGEGDGVSGSGWRNTGTRSDLSDNDGDSDASEPNSRKIYYRNIEELEQVISSEVDRCSQSSKSQTAEPAHNSQRLIRKGDQVKYTGPSADGTADNRKLSVGQRGEVVELNGDKVAVIFYTGGNNGDKVENGEKKSKSAEISENSLHWVDVKEIEPVLDIEAENCYLAIRALCEVLHSVQPLIVYFADSNLWLSGTSKSKHRDFLQEVEEMFNELAGPVVLICGQSKVETGTKDKEKITMILPNFANLNKLPLTLKKLAEGFKASKRSESNGVYKLFNNVISIHPPKEEDLLRTFNKQIDDDRRIIISRSNFSELQKVLEENLMCSADLINVNTDGLILTRQKAERIVGWAKNHYLSSCQLPCVKGDRLLLPVKCLEIAISRLKELEKLSDFPSQNLKNLAKDEYEQNFISAVVPPGEIGIKFDDIGALEDVKNALNELVILPMRRPELFSIGNLLRPCKGILLFGPPGTGKTLLAKALATEARANFISVTGSSLTSKWFGDAEKLTKALFSFAGRLAPVIIFVDEVDSLLGARGGAFEHEATRRMRNEFMAAWDGLRSKDSEKILILGATNRPFDLDDAVIRRLPRRIYVDLPNAENRLKILKIILSQENLEPEFQFNKLANETEGYSGSDLKNLCVAAAYRPIQELMEQEKKGEARCEGSTVRPLKLDDFILSKAKVGPSVAYDAATMNELRKWNEQYGEGGSRNRSPFGFGN